MSGELQRGFVSVSTGPELTDPTNPDIIRGMEPAWTYGRVDPAEDFFGNPAFNQLVSHYLTRFQVSYCCCFACKPEHSVIVTVFHVEMWQNASFLIPIGGLKMTESLLQLSNNRALFLIGDKV